MRLFWRIFFFFWIATILMITLVLTVNEFAPMSFPGEHDRRFQPDATLPALTAAVNAYEQQGPAAFRSQAQRLPRIKHGELYVFDQQGSPLLTDSKDYSFYALMAQDVLQSGHSEFIRLASGCSIHAHWRVLLANTMPLFSQSLLRRLVFGIFGSDRT
jgi:hypothetical protein